MVMGLFEVATATDDDNDDEWSTTTEEDEEADAYTPPAHQVGTGRQTTTDVAVPFHGVTHAYAPRSFDTSSDIKDTHTFRNDIIRCIRYRDWDGLLGRLEALEGEMEWEYKLAPTDKNKAIRSSFKRGASSIRDMLSFVTNTKS